MHFYFHLNLQHVFVFRKPNYSTKNRVLFGPMFFIHLSEDYPLLLKLAPKGWIQGFMNLLSNQTKSGLGIAVNSRTTHF